MIFTIGLKCPDCVDHSLTAAAEREILIRGDADPDAVPNEHAHLREAISPWFRHGEYCTIEIDTEAKTARVVPVS